MLGKSHKLVANLSLACLEQKERHILYPRWGGIESGATLSDEFRIMWDTIEVGKGAKQLVHRCYVDSDNPKDHGCITRAFEHATGCISFINSYLKGDLADSYTEDSFLENLGMFLWITSHHIADLCTPVHVGHKINYKAMGYSSLSQFHNKVERDILRYYESLSIQLPKPRLIEITESYFWDIARDTYENSFLILEKIYADKDEHAIINMASRVISQAVLHSCNIWHTILIKTGMTKQKWSMMPLL